MKSEILFFKTERNGTKILEIQGRGTKKVGTSNVLFILPEKEEFILFNNSY
jgi:hypothetical protein